MKELKTGQLERHVDLGTRTPLFSLPKTKRGPVMFSAIAIALVNMNRKDYPEITSDQFFSYLARVYYMTIKMDHKTETLRTQMVAEYVEKKVYDFLMGTARVSSARDVFPFWGQFEELREIALMVLRSGTKPAQLLSYEAKRLFHEQIVGAGMNIYNNVWDDFVTSGRPRYRRSDFAHVAKSVGR